MPVRPQQVTRLAGEQPVDVGRVQPGGHRIVESESRANPQGRHLHNDWKQIHHLWSVEVTGEAGKYNELQIAAMSDLGRKLLGVDPW